MNESENNSKNRKRSLIEWGVIIGIILLLYASGWHTQVIGTMQRGLLATGLIKPSVPELTNDFPVASREFYFADEDGRITSLADFDDNVVFMNIWATWCPPCIAEMPSIQALYNSMRDEQNIAFVLVSMDEDFSKAIEFMKKRNYDMPIFHYRTKARGSYESTVIPTTYVISRDGRLVLEKRGLAKYDTPEFKEFLLELSR